MATRAPADIVLGQSGFGQDGFACGPSAMHHPETLWTAGGKLVVADSANNRVLIWKKIPTVSGQPPDLVLGQGDLNTCVINNDGSGAKGGAPTAASFSFPAGVWTDGKRLVVNDYHNCRVLIWKKFPKHNFQPANRVLGQPDFTCAVENNDGSGTCSEGSPSAQNLGCPEGISQIGNRLIVDDTCDNRYLIYKAK